MNVLSLFFVIIAFVVFVLGALGVQSKFNLIAAGLAFYMLAQLATTLRF